jgi:hypothetical protein
MIVKLTEEAIGQQKQAIELLKSGQTPKSLVAQKISYKNLTDIQKLLPKQQNKQKNQQNKQDQQKQDKQKQDQEQKQDQQQDKQQQEQQKQENQEQEKQKTEESKEEKDVRRLLEKVLDREREHKEEKEKRLNQIPLPAFERDW